jgi:hypothetical protein
VIILGAAVIILIAIALLNLDTGDDDDGNY